MDPANVDQRDGQTRNSVRDHRCYLYLHPGDTQDQDSQYKTSVTASANTNGENCKAKAAGADSSCSIK